MSKREIGMPMTGFTEQEIVFANRMMFDVLNIKKKNINRKFHLPKQISSHFNYILFIPCFNNIYIQKKSSKLLIKMELFFFLYFILYKKNNRILMQIVFSYKELVYYEMINKMKKFNLIERNL